MAHHIDLSDLDSVAAQLPKLEKLYEEKLAAQRALNAEVEYMRRLLAHASGVSRGQLRPMKTAIDRRAGPQRRRRASPAQDRAVHALERASIELGGSALGPTSLYKYMRERGLDLPTSAGALGTNLHDAWCAGRIMRAPNGVYTPLDGTGRNEWDRPLTDYYYAAEMGFPVPGRASSE